MTDGINTRPTLQPQVEADPKQGINTRPTLVAPLDPDSKQGINTRPTFVDPVDLDDDPSADVIAFVAPQELDAIAAEATQGGAGVIDTIFLQRSTVGLGAQQIGHQAAQGTRAKANVFTSGQVQAHGGTDGYVISIVDPDTVRTDNPVVEGNTIPRARVKGLRGGPF
jgi:hypothetical protein